MVILRFLLKVLAFPIMLVIAVLQWVGIFLISFSSVVFNLITGLFLLVAILSYLMGLAAGPEALKMIIAGFVVFMIPVAGEAIVTAVSAANAGLRDFFRS